jgi:hypothetical protein
MALRAGWLDAGPLVILLLSPLFSAAAEWQARQSSLLGFCSAAAVTAHAKKQIRPAEMIPPAFIFTPLNLRMPCLFYSLK